MTVAVNPRAPFPVWIPIAPEGSRDIEDTYFGRAFRSHRYAERYLHERGIQNAQERDYLGAKQVTIEAIARHTKHREIEIDRIDKALDELVFEISREAIDYAQQKEITKITPVRTMGINILENIADYATYPDKYTFVVRKHVKRALGIKAEATRVLRLVSGFVGASFSYEATESVGFSIAGGLTGYYLFNLYLEKGTNYKFLLKDVKDSMKSLYERFEGKLQLKV